MFLLDTNACIDFLSGRSRALASRMDVHFGRLWVSAISIAELMVGSSLSEAQQHEAERVTVFVANVKIADFDLACAQRYGALVRQIGVRRKSFDRLIGVQAVQLGLTLVTRNGRDFADVPGLRFEDWTV